MRCVFARHANIVYTILGRLRTKQGARPVTMQAHDRAPLPDSAPRLSPLLSSAFFLGLVFAALDIVLPLWLTGELGYTAADWARVRSLRMAGILVSVILLGGLSDRFGQRRLGWLSLLACGIALSILALGPPGGVWILIPIIGGCISTAFVNMNTLTQGISAERQGFINASYRGIHATTGIIAPVAVTALAVAFGGYPRVLMLCAVSMLLSALLLRRFPREETAPFATLSEEFRNLFSGYQQALSQKPLMRFIVVSILWGAMISVVGAFAAIRFVRELGFSDRAFGIITATGGLLTLAAILLSGFVLDRMPLRTFSLWASGGASLAALVMGLSESPALSAIAYCLHMPLAGALNAPFSMWVSRASGTASQTSAFAVQKFLSGGIFAISMLVMGWLEPVVGIRHLLAGGGVLALLASLYYLRMPEPGSR